MSDNTINEIAKASPDMHKERIEQLKALLPDLFDGEGQLDETALRALICDEAGVVAERFSFGWAGKQKSKRLAFTPSRATLVYDPARSLNHDGTQNKAGQTAEQNTSENLIIEGDNLEVLKLLQTTYFEQVKCIYIDPPYNTGNDFIYPDNFSETKKAYWEKNGAIKEGVKLTALPETHGRRHSDWLNFMQSRLLLARQMLREDGVIFVSIDDNEEHHLRFLCNSIFGEENHLGCLIWRKKEGGGMAGDYFATEHEYIVVYKKSDEFTWRDEIEELDINTFNKEDESGKKYKQVKLSKWGNTARKEDRPSMHFPIVGPDGEKIYPIAPDGNAGRWRVGKNKMEELLFSNKINFINRDGVTIPYEKIYFDPKKVKNKKLRSILYNVGGTALGTNQLTTIFGKKDIFENPKPTFLLNLFLQCCLENNDIFLDFFAGSGTSAHAVMKQNAEDNGNRKHILVQIPEITDEKSEAYKAGYKKISDITIERVKRAGAKIREENPDAKIDTGFRVFKLTHSNFAENLFTPDEDKSDAENMKALETHLTEATQMRLFDADEFNNLVTEISLKNGFGLFYQLEAMTDFKHNKIYRLHGNGKSALLCLDNSLHDNSVENLKTFKEEQLIVSSSALDTSKKFSLKTKFKGNLRVF